MIYGQGIGSKPEKKNGIKIKANILLCKQLYQKCKMEMEE
jgi:hypothetical protein